MKEVKQELENSVISTADRILKFEFSNTKEDYTNDIIMQNFDLERFRKNPVFLYDHKQEQLPIGRVVSIESSNGVTSGEVEFWINDGEPSTWSETDKLANTIYKQYKEGFLKGVSIRVKPIDVAINPNSKNGKGLIVKKSTLLEISATSLPMNEDSLKKHLKIKKEEINMTNKNEIAKSMLEGAGVEKVECTEMEDMKKHLRDGSIAKTLQESVDADGGILIPENMKEGIVKTSYAKNPLRALAGISTIGQGNALKVPVEDESANEFSTGWRAEDGSVSETDTAKFIEVNIPVDELYAEPQATRFMVKDVNFDLEGYVSEKVSEAFTRDEAEAYLTGTGINQPKGLLTGITADVTYSTGAEDKGDLVAMVKALPEQYQDNAVFLMNNKTYIEMANKEFTDGRSILAEDFSAPVKDTILGYPVVVYPAMDDLGTVGNQAIMFGDFSKAYHIVDHTDMGVIRDDITKKGYVKYYTWKRTGGNVLVRGAYVVSEEIA